LNRNGIEKEKSLIRDNQWCQHQSDSKMYTAEMEMKAHHRAYDCNFRWKHADIRRGRLELRNAKSCQFW